MQRLAVNPSFEKEQEHKVRLSIINLSNSFPHLIKVYHYSSSKPSKCMSQSQGSSGLCIPESASTIG